MALQTPPDDFPAVLQLRIEKTCKAAIEDFRRFPCEETFLRAAGRLDGILQGAALTLETLEEPAGASIRSIQQTVSCAQRDLHLLGEKEGLPNLP